MDSSSVPPTRVRAAIALSIAIHLCALALLAIVVDGRTVIPSESIEEAPLFAITTVVHRASAPRRTVAAVPHRRPTPAPAATAAPPRVKIRLYAREPSAAPAASLQRRSMRAPAQIAPDPRRAPFSPRDRAPEIAMALAATPTPTPDPPTPTPTPTPLPSPTPSATPAAVAAANFGGLFSQNYPPALVTAPSMVTAIRARLGGHGRIRVTVDETGRATDVHFIAGVPADADAQEIRAELLGVSYVPADCNGLHCDGTLDIIY